jgi:aminoglycoside phosphotransferase (APT) family kinase protein
MRDDGRRARIRCVVIHPDEPKPKVLLASLVHGDLHLGNVAKGPGGPLIFDWTDACVAHPFLDLATIRRGTGEVDVAEAELRARLRAAYLAGLP